jgi:perosamine synthetase
MVVTGHAALHDRMVLLKSHAATEQGEYWHVDVGHNYRMTNVCAAIGLAQMEQAARRVAQKQQVETWYRAALTGTPLVWPETTDGATRACWLVSALAPTTSHRHALRTFLRERGIKTAPFFTAIHQMPMFFREQQRFPVAEELAGRGLSLPSSPLLTETDVEQIAGVVSAYFRTAA